MLDKARKLLKSRRYLRHFIQERIRKPDHRRWVAKALRVTLPRYEPASEVGAAHAAALEEAGFVMIDNAFDPATLKRIRTELEGKLCSDGWNPELGSFPIKDAPASSNTLYIHDVETVPETVALANSPAILEIVARYLGRKPLINDIAAWWSVPGPSQPREEQFYHRDNDAIRFVKLFIYLSDVGDNDGPHVFVRGSHRSSALLTRSKRHSDAEVAAQINPADVVRFTGPFGTTFLEDTYGLHKGELPTENARLVLQVRYSLVESTFARPENKNADTSLYDPYINRLISAR